MELRPISAFLILCALTTIEAAKILVTVTVPSPSLFNIKTPIIEALYNRNHEVTIQSIYPLKRELPNATFYQMQPSHFGTDEGIWKDFLYKLAEANPLSEVYSFLGMNDITCLEYLEDPSTKTLLAAGKQFDIVIADGISDCVLAVASLLGKHIVEDLASPYYPWGYSDVPAPPSYVPNYYRTFPSKMTFWQRLTNTVDITVFRLIDELKKKPTLEKMLAQHLPQAASMDTIRSNNIAFSLSIGDHVTQSPRPSMPNVVYCGGIHCTDPKPLPKEMKDFVESSGDEGFIMFGLGTNMKSTFLPSKTLDAILGAFSRLKQKIIWKFEAQLKNRPKNVMITNWMPQQDLLGHSKCRLFITHSGLLSLQETVYHGVPVIGIPLFMDQPGNIGRLEEIGMAEHIDFFNITEDGLYNLITKILNNPSYRNNAKKYSTIYKDQPVKPLDRTIYWIEYVLRHDGMAHFRPAVKDLNFFQYFLLDVIAFIFLVTATAVVTIVAAGKFIVKKCSSKKHKTDCDKKRK